MLCLPLTLSLTLLVSLLLTFNIFHILNDVKNAEICFILKKTKKVSLTDFKLKCFSFRVHLHPENIAPSNLSFVRIYA